MALLQILKIPDPRLKIKAKVVDKVDDSIKLLLADMTETMYANDGVGLAATQVGIDKRVMIIDAAGREDSDRRELMSFVNPEILWHSDERDPMDEGCLSVPEEYAKVKRFLKLKVRYSNEHNKVIECDMDGFLAQAFQHELDHLDGILFIDHLSSLKRGIIMGKAMKGAKRAKF